MSRFKRYLYLWMTAFAALVILLSSLATTCCGPAGAGMPSLTAVDAIVSGIGTVLRWCEDHDVTPEKILEAKQALDNKDYLKAAELAQGLLEKVAEDEQVPDDVAVLLQLAKGAAAAQAIQDGMSAISQPVKPPGAADTPDASAATSPPSSAAPAPSAAPPGG